MAWPADGKATIRSLATPAGKVTDVTLLGCARKLDLATDRRRLGRHLARGKAVPFAYGLKILGDHLKAAPPHAVGMPAPPVR